MAALLQFPLDSRRRARTADTATSAASGAERSATVVIFPGIRIERRGTRATDRREGSAQGAPALPVEHR